VGGNNMPNMYYQQPYGQAPGANQYDYGQLSTNPMAALQYEAMARQPQQAGYNSQDLYRQQQPLYPDQLGQYNQLGAMPQQYN